MFGLQCLLTASLGVYLSGISLVKLLELHRLGRKLEYFTGLLIGINSWTLGRNISWRRGISVCAGQSMILVIIIFSST